MKNILMNIEMTKAILDGCKSQFREIILNDNKTSFIDWTTESKYQKGETIFVKEEILVDGYLDAWYTADNSYVEAFIDDGKNPYPKLDESKYDDEYVGIIKAEDMPKECARIFLKITNVRVERLQDMKTLEILLEGIHPNKDNDFSNKQMGSMKSSNELNKDWINLWDKTAPKGYKWEDNPFCFVYEFERS